MVATAVLFAVLFVGLLTRAVDLAVLRGPDFARRAANQHRTRVALTPRRGEIVDRNGDKLALSLDVPSVYVRPKAFAGHEADLPAVGRALGLSLKTVQAKVASRQPFVWLRRRATPRQAEAVERLGLPGIGTLDEARRFYPYGSLAAHVLGMVGIDSRGLEGLEHRFDEVIRGESEWLDVDRDAHGREILRAGGASAPPQGNRLELTLDVGLQAIVERELAAGVATAKAAGGSAVVLDPWTGEVLALANVPTFNPNDPGNLGDPRFRARVRNRAITDPYEPGSTFKAVLAAAALDQRVVRPDEMFFCENGHYQVGKWTIHDSHPHGWLSFAQVIQVSSNIGASKVGERLGRERYFQALRAFGFGGRTGIELPAEEPGLMRPVDTWARIDLATHSFGQGVAVTPLQMAAAFAAIANGGTYMRPYLVRRSVSPDGAVLFEHQATAVMRVVRPESARTTTQLLRRVVEEEGGTGGKARVEGFSVAGKTGTAQKVDPRNGGYSSKRIGSFVGFVPADAPRVVILVLIDEPGTSSYGGVVAAPVFSAIANGLLKALGVQPAAPEVQVVAAPPPAPAPAPVEVPVDGTPSYLGLSLREAYTRARTDGWDVQISGTGYVATQEPAVGAVMPAPRRLLLTLRPERVASAAP